MRPARSPEAAAPAPRYRSAALQIMFVAALLVALVLAMAGIVPASAKHLRHAAAGWIAIEVILEVIACASYALLFHGVFSHGAYRFGLTRGAQIGVGELGAFVVTPAGAGGTSSRSRGRPQSRWRRVSRDIIDGVPSGVRELPTRLREPGLLPLAIGYWAGDCGVLIIAFRSAHGSAPLAVIVLAYMLGQ